MANNILELLGFSPYKFWQDPVYLSKYLIFLQISSLTSMKKLKNSLELLNHTRNTRKFAKHRHARRARVIFFCELKGFGDSRIKSMTCKMNLTRLHININISLFSNRQFDSFFDTTHTVIGVTCGHA